MPRRLRSRVKVLGNVNADDKVEITPSGSVEGDLCAPRVALADGSSFKGAIDMSGSGSQTTVRRTTTTSATRERWHRRRRRRRAPAAATSTASRGGGMLSWRKTTMQAAVTPAGNGDAADRAVDSRSGTGARARAGTGRAGPDARPRVVVRHHRGLPGRPGGPGVGRGVRAASGARGRVRRMTRAGRPTPDLSLQARGRVRST